MDNYKHEPWVAKNKRVQSITFDAIERSNRLCEYCGNHYDHVHHIIPLSQGGEDSLDNMVVLCKNCHMKAHNDNFFGHALNQEMLSFFISLNKSRPKQTFNDIVDKIIALQTNAKYAQNNKSWKKTRTFYSGQYVAYTEVLNLLNSIEV